MRTRPRRRDMLGTLGALLGGLASGPLQAAAGISMAGEGAEADASATASAWLGDVDVVPLPANRGSPPGLRISVLGTPGATVRIHLAGRAPMVLAPSSPAPVRRGTGPQAGRYAGHLMARRGGEDERAGLAERFLIELSIGHDSATAVVEPLQVASRARTSTSPAPAIDEVTLTHDGGAPPSLSVIGTPGAQALAWVTTGGGGLRAVPLTEPAPGRYRARLVPGTTPVAVELARGRQVRTVSLHASASPMLAVAMPSD
ncbi:MAG: hypothetical protein H6933_01635 [Burkholderiaceae bacterium]|nr:hypothetical protein [Rhodoferax sp.]MCP5283581.1 hypothetical protein [Burkholderiaceae bacterium]